MSKGNKNYYTVALVSGGADSAYHTVIADNMAHECHKNNHKIIWYQSLCTDDFTGKPYEVGEMNIYNLINYDLIDVVVMLSLTMKSEKSKQDIIDRAKEHGVPLISIDEEIEGAYNIKMDYEAGLEDLIRHVIEKHKVKSLGFITGMKGHEQSDAREQKFRELLAEYDIPVNEDYIDQAYFWHVQAEVVVQQWYDKKKTLPDAIICANDSMAIGASNKIIELGYRIPDDIIVTGLDGIEEAMNYSPSITTAKLNITGMAKRVSELIEPICSGKIKAEGLEIIEAERLLSQSCGCKPVSTAQYENAIKHRIYDDMNCFKNSNRVVINLAEEVSAGADFEATVDGAALFLKRIWSKESYICICDDFLSDISCIEEFKSDYDSYRTEGYSENIKYCIRVKSLGANNYETERKAPFKTADLLPDLDTFFENNTGLMVLPLHYQDRTIGYIAIEFQHCEGNFSVLNTFDGNVIGMVLENARVQCELRRFANRLEELYIRDPMTNLLNRRGFFRFVPSIYEDCIKNKKQFMIISVDLDELKDINDIHGHADGDNAIITIANALNAAALNGEVTARFGGDEYVVAGVCETEDYGDLFIKRVRDFLDNYNSISGKPYTVRASCGIYKNVPENCMSLDEFISGADKVMYEEKMLSKRHRGISRRRM